MSFMVLSWQVFKGSMTDLCIAILNTDSRETLTHLDECQYEARNWEIDNMVVICELFNSKGVVNISKFSKNENYDFSSLRT